MTSMITDQVGRHEVLLVINHNYLTTKFVRFDPFLKLKWCILSSYLGMTCTVLLH